MSFAVNLLNSEAISVIGLGKLGAPLAACLASKGFTVIGVDTDPDKIRLINEKKPPVFEPHLDEYLRASVPRLTATTDLELAISASAVTFIVVPTPSNEEGGFSTRYVVDAAQKIGKALSQKSGFHLVVLTSTVSPGSTEEEVQPLLETCSGKQCGVDFGLCYGPEFIALGSVIRGFLNPDFVLIGESDPDSGDILASIYRRACENNPPIARMNLVNAELTKLAVNTFVTTKITYANMVAEICERLPGGDADVVTSALGLDSRIGPKYLKGGLGYGGPCFPRDNVALAHLARQVGASATLAEATDAANREQIPRLVELVASRLNGGGRVGVLGLSYKPNTDVVDEAQGLLLAQSLLAKDLPVVVFDPAAMGNARPFLDGAVFVSSWRECIQHSDVIVIATPWEEFKEIEPAHLIRANPRRVLVDCWRILDGEKLNSVVEYIPLGVGLQQRETLQVASTTGSSNLGG